jgi:hypothetical protein
VRLRLLPLLVLVLALVPALVACGSEPAPAHSSYKPVPDTTLYQQIGDLPGVTQVDIEWVDDATRGKSYVGRVRVRDGVDRLRRLDQVLAILRQGRAGAGITVSVGTAHGVAKFPSDLGVITPEEIEERYGPQPGDGTPPDSTPAAP